MKKVYISCYENNDYLFKDLLVKSNEVRGSKLFQLIESNPDLIEKDFQSKKENIIPFIKKTILKTTDVVIFLIGNETKKRRVADWEARAAMIKYGIFEKCGIVIIYLPELIEKYGTKIPRTVLPNILRHNIDKADVFMVETTWDKIKRDINILDKLLNTAYAYSKMSKYDLESCPIEIENTNNFPENSFQ